MIGLDFGSSKVCVAIARLPQRDVQYLDFNEGKFVQAKEDRKAIILPAHFFLECLERRVSVGHHALSAVQDARNVALLDNGKAIFISQLKSKMYRAPELSCRLVKSLFQLVEGKIQSLAMDDDFTIFSAPPTAGKEYQRIIRKSAEDAGLRFGGFLEEPLCILLASRILESNYAGKSQEIGPLKESQKIITIDAGVNYITFVSLHAQNQNQGKWEIKIDGLRIFSGLAGAEITKKIIAYSQEQHPEDPDRLLKDTYEREALGERLRQLEPGLSEGYGGHYREEISKKWKDAMEEFKNEIKIPDGPDRVIISGGVSRVQRFRQLVGATWGPEKCLYLDPDTAVAEGAALYAAGLAPELSLKKEYHIGIGLKSGPFFPMLSSSELQDTNSLEFWAHKDKDLYLSNHCVRRTFIFKPFSGEQALRPLEIWAYYGLSSKNTGNIPLGHIFLDEKKLAISRGTSFVARIVVDTIGGRLFGSLALYDTTLTNLYGSTELEFPE